MKSTATSTPSIAREIGKEDQRALEHADQHDAVGMIGRDLTRQARHALFDLALVEQRGRGRDEGGFVHSASVSRTASRNSAVRSRRPSVASSTNSSCNRTLASGLRWRT